MQATSVFAVSPIVCSLMDNYVNMEVQSGRNYLITYYNNVGYQCAPTSHSEGINILFSYILPKSFILYTVSIKPDLKLPVISQFLKLECVCIPCRF